jgi:hypothetical protein
MHHAVDIQLTDFMRAFASRDAVKVGHYFVFVEPRALGSRPQRSGLRGRLERLLVNREPEARGRVLPLFDRPVELAGVTLTPRDRGIAPMACLVTDRDLYRAEVDTVHLYAAMPGPRDGVSLVVTCHGEPFTERALSFQDGVALASLAALLPGQYTARLMLSDRPFGQAVSFTVAEYTLAPLSGRLLSHALDRAAQQLTFELAVESYQVPFEDPLAVVLVDAGREVASTTLSPAAPGRYRGALPLRGEGPFRLQLQSAHDAGRVAEVVLPGARARERALTVVSELGTERLFSLMPEPGALPVRGGYLSEGDVLSTPLIVDQIVTERGVIRARADVDELALVTLDLATGQFSTQSRGHVAAGEDVAVDTDGAVTMVFAGGFVQGRPFEGYTTFLRPTRLALDVEVAATARPYEELVVRLRCQSTARVPVLLCVRDQRLTATDTPEKALAAAAKAGIDAATAGMAESGIESLAALLEDTPWGPSLAIWDQQTSSPDMNLAAPAPAPSPSPVRTMASPSWAVAPSGRPMGGRSSEVASEGALRGAEAPSLARARAEARGHDDVAKAKAAVRDDFDEEATGLQAAAGAQMEDVSLDLARLSEPAELDGAAGGQAGLDTGAVPPARATFPELLFYGVVPVSGQEDVRVALGDTLSTFVVEAFALHGGDWAEARASVVVDQPVRVDLDLPPAVHPGDRVRGGLRAHVTSGRARVRLACDGAAVSLRRADNSMVQPDEVLATPVELVFDVVPGSYRAEVADAAGGETDALERQVGVPGRFKHLLREVGLLQAGDAITLDSAGALSLRILPAIDEPFDMLVTATAGYEHLCCEQTAAKILAAVFMYLAADGPQRRQQAQDIIVAGVARERTMLRPNQGFAMYPDRDMISDHYSRLAVRYLWNLDQLDQIAEVSPVLREAAREGVSLADVAAGAHGMARVPERISSMEDAYAAVRADAHLGEVRTYIDRAVEIDGRGARVRDAVHAVADRAQLAYAAACLFALGDHARGVRAAGAVTRQLNEQGALYSTVDSVAAIALMVQMRVAGVVASSGRVRVNGREMSALEATTLGERVETVEVLSGVAAVEVARILEEDWAAFAGGVPVKIGFRDGSDNRAGRFRMGDRVELVVSLSGGYQPGDLVHVSLPACMSWLHGGGKVKRFTVDFAGKDEVRVPVIVTGAIEGPQHFAACVRNMFEEERAGSPGLIAVHGAAR